VLSEVEEEALQISIDLARAHHDDLSMESFMIWLSLKHSTKQKLIVERFAPFLNDAQRKRLLERQANDPYKTFMDYALSLDV